jgi:hypothetical protein
MACYESQRIGLGGEFRREFEAALVRVRENPQLYAVEHDDGTRYCLLRRFLYTIVFIEMETDVWIAAVAHQKRRPKYWTRRRRPS